MTFEPNIAHAAALGEIDSLTDAELRAMQIAVILGVDPRGSLGFEKVAALFTENDALGAPQATSTVREAFAMAWEDRFGQSGGPR
jgi:hypothetical protein